MTRKKEIDKDKVLDATEAVIVESGGRTLTLDAVAARAGISKGGLVYTFTSKDALIYAALEREMGRFRSAVAQRLQSMQSTSSVAKPAGQLVLAHLEEALDESSATTNTAAFLITALVHAPTMLEPIKVLYDDLLQPLKADPEQYADIRHALLAVEGMFLLKGLGLADFSAAEIKSILKHARQQVLKALADDK